MKDPRQVPHYLNIFPTGKIPVPVCIGDLPLANYCISQDTPTEIVTDYLENDPLVPGVILTKNDQLFGVIPRSKMFERLGHRYGVELFLRKPIHEMDRELMAEVFILKSHLPINVAVKLALSRIQHNIYDPIIVEFEDKSMRLLDMYVLLLTQSQLSNNLSGIVSSLNNIETILSSEKADPITTLDLIMESLNLVVPSHHIRILLQSMPEYDLLSSHELVLYHEELADRNRIFRSVLQMNQAIVAEDVQHVPSWGNSDSPENTRSWMGVPLSNQNGTIGLLSLSRHTFSPFTNNEKELAQVFARYITSLFSTLTRRLEKKHIFQRKY
jgi:hypothetical protein